MLCTIVTDASFCPETNVGGWAAWVVCNDVREKQYGAFKDLCKSATEAEIKAAINGAFIAKRSFSQITRYHFVTDCEAVIRYIEKRNNQWWQIIEDIVGQSEVTVKHVRAHKNTGSARSWVNGWCDKKARREMRKARDSR